MQKEKVLFVLPGMKGGGAERVVALLANEFHQSGTETSVLLTAAKKEEIVRVDLKEEIPLLLFDDIKESVFGKFLRKALRVFSSAGCKVFEKSGKPVPASWAYLSFWSEYKNQVLRLRSILRQDPDLRVIAFLQPSIPIAVLAAHGLPNRVIISERGDPGRLMKKRYGRKFIEKYYDRVDAAVFQTQDARNTYPENVAEKGTVIPNPLKSDLPEPYTGERNKNITTFCRLSPEKGLQYLIDAFAKLHEEYPDYRLRIVGGAVLGSEKEYLERLNRQIAELALAEYILAEPFSPNVHEMVLQDSMYINCSEREGMSNAMLEALAIGMPVVCTDCPIGGARATIRDGENGLLIPVRDSEALYRAMKRVIEEPGLAEKISANAVKIRKELSVSSVTRQWMELL